MILKIFYYARSPGRLVGSMSLMEILPMNVCLRDSARKVERFKVYVRESGRGCLDLAINDCQEEIITKKAYLLERISEH